ncbi:MAG: lysophospholipid acyltransferase family protein [Gammaproteobacteria bacterium]|jgi:1-acyl-sn-glycerol-3-phosphate acyltransferase|nr:lysophospholipid acyltransferase family protein [Gammaproteobacteria bacterium]
MSSGSHKRSLADLLYGLWFAASFCGCALAAIILACCVPGAQRRRRAMRATSSALFRLAGAAPAVNGAEHLPAGPAVAVANHASYLDGLLLTAVLPESYQFVIKREVTRVPVMHFVLRRVGAHFVDRTASTRAAADLRAILRTAGDGASLAFFPEGTFTAEPGLRPFRSGAFVLAQRCGVPLVPITLQGTRAMLPADQWLPARAPLTVTLHRTVLAQPDGGAPEAMQRCRAAILSVLDEPDLG